MPSELSRIVHKMLAKSPDDRHASAMELLRDLRQVRIEGLEVDWPDELLDLGAAEQMALSDSPIEATQQLDALMKASAGQARSGRGRRIWAAIVVLAFLGGSALAWGTRSTAMLQIEEGQQMARVEKKDTVEEQFFYAMWMRTEEAWESVSEYFPADTPNATERGRNKPYTLRAKQHLGRHYLETEQYSRALEVYTELANLDRTEELFRAYGLAGQAIAFAHLGQQDELASAWASAQNLRKYLDEDMRTELNRLENTARVRN